MLSVPVPMQLFVEISQLGSSVSPLPASNDSHRLPWHAFVLELPAPPPAAAVAVVPALLPAAGMLAVMPACPEGPAAGLLPAAALVAPLPAVELDAVPALEAGAGAFVLALELGIAGVELAAAP
jgi:hypothetical protein